MLLSATEAPPIVAFEWKRVLGVTLLAIFVGVVACIVFIVVLAIWMAATGRHLSDTHNAGSAFVQVTTAALELPIAFVVIFFLPRLAREPLSSLGYRGLRPRDAVAILVAFAAIIVGDVVYGIFLKAIHQAGHAQTGFEHMSFAGSAEAVIAFIVLCVAAPFAEETFFRAFLFNAFAKWTPVWLAAAISAALFAAMHGDVRHAALLAYLGLTSTVLYRRTGNIYASIVLHGLNNGLFFLGILVHPRHGS